jgi:hypothetical protein
VIIVTWDAAHGKEHVTTWGQDAEQCRQAAMGGNRVKQALGWPDALCHAEPRRAKKEPPTRVVDLKSCDCGHAWDKHNHLGCHGRRSVNDAPGHPGSTFCGCEKVAVPCGTFGCVVPRPEDWHMCHECWAEYQLDPEAFK